MSQFNYHFNGSSHWFTVQASNGEVVGRSETYSSKQACQVGAQVVKAQAPSAANPGERVATPGQGKYEVFEGMDKQYYFRLRAAGNSEIILQSEGYKTARGADEGVQASKRAVAGATP